MYILEALYCLKQPPRSWYTKVDGYFKKRSFDKRKNEPIIYSNKEDDDIFLICMYVDNLIYMVSSSNVNENFKVSIMSEF